MRLALASTTEAGSIEASMGPLLSATAPIRQASDAPRQKRGIRRDRDRMGPPMRLSKYNSDRLSKGRTKSPRRGLTPDKAFIFNGVDPEQASPSRVNRVDSPTIWGIPRPPPPPGQ